MDFRDLANERQLVHELCRKHVPSLLAFKFETGASFKLFWDESEAKPAGGVHHLTTTATCIESLVDCHTIFRPKDKLEKLRNCLGVSEQDVVRSLTTAFYSGSVERDWSSEDSAPIYAAIRALPLFLNGATTWTDKHRELVHTIYEQLGDNDRFGIGEKNTKGKNSNWYPENAYHTYWALRVMQVLRKSFSKEAKRAINLDLNRLWESMRLWARAKLAEEVGLHWAQSATLDSDQLIWALTTFLEFGSDLSSDLRGQDLIRKAFESLASTQEPIGTWRHYRPLFVYSNVGNAYCYVFESFTFLLKAVLNKFEEQEFLEDVIRSFAERLQRLRRYAQMTQVQHKKDIDAIAWSSGHRPAEPKPEGWATASVFSYLQAYRRLLGILARRDAISALPMPVLTKPSAALKKLAERGDTWPPPNTSGSVSEDLITLFVNPVRMIPSRNAAEPDDQPIKESQARSAILFGPPGASKTTLARSVASALQWEYIELHSSHFVAEGIQEIQRTADRIFAYLMELDHAVVLFDEPDELVREREGAPDAFGRFLTTSMLPKLAELWKQRRIIYFIATNHIRFFDAAIVRSERFDLLAFVSPPSFKRKIDELKRLLTALRGASVEFEFTVTQFEIEAALSDLCRFRTGRRWHSEANLPSESQLAKFILLRWDQLHELAFGLATAISRKAKVEINATHLSDALGKISDQRLQKLHTYLDYLDDFEHARRDFQRKPVFKVKDFPSDSKLPENVEQTQSGLWLKCPSGMRPATIPGYTVQLTGEPGEVTICPDPSSITNPRSPASSSSRLKSKKSSAQHLISPR